MSVALQQEVVQIGLSSRAVQADRDVRRGVMAGRAGLALLLAGGGLLIRVTLIAFSTNELTAPAWLFTAVACLLAGVALVLIALPRVQSTDIGEGTTPDAVGEPPSGGRSGGRTLGGRRPPLIS